MKNDKTIRKDTEIRLSKEETDRIVKNISAVSVGGNVLLVVFKMIAGILGHSGARVSDAVHSLSDVLSTVVAVVGVKISQKTADRNHPYGHERLECVAAIFLAAILFATGAGIGYSALQNIIQGNVSEVPGMIALIAAVVSILTKEAMYRYTKVCAIRIHSSAFLADAWHHRSDALSSIGALIGIAGARMGYPVLDQLAGFVICIFIFKVSFDILKDSLDKMLDKAADKETVKSIKSKIAEQPGVEKIDMIKTRMFGDRIYVDVEIAIKKDVTLEVAHDIAEHVHHTVEETFSEVKHIMVHMNPCD